MANRTQPSWFELFHHPQSREPTESHSRRSTTKSTFKTETRISTTAPSGGVQTIGKSTECLIVICSVGYQGIGAAVRSVALMLIAALFAVSPLRVSGATPDPVLDWIGVMNSTVLTAGTGFLATHATGERIRRDTATCHTNALGTDATLAVPLAAATGPRQPRIRCRSQRSERDG